jgi:DNA repair photolyase
MQKITEFVKEYKTLQESKRRDEENSKFDSLLEAKLKELGVKSISELSEEELELFKEYVKNIKEQLKKKSVNEKDDEVKDEKSFKEYAENVLKKAHGDDYDQDIADKVINGIISKMGDSKDWGQAIGRLTSGLGG